jgi:hypothetical protein
VSHLLAEDKTNSLIGHQPLWKANKRNVKTKIANSVIVPGNNNVVGRRIFHQHSKLLLKGN